MSHDDALLLDILNAARKAIKFVEGIPFDEFVEREAVQSSVFWQIGIIGEAARHISDSYKSLHKNIPWFEMAGMRNRLVHDYKRIDLEEVWDTIEQSIPELIKLLEPLVRREK